MKQQSTAAQLMKANPTLHFPRSDDLIDRMETIHALVAKRAFEIFDDAGRPTDRELEHWLRAESELLHPVHVTVADSGNGLLTLRAEVPGFSAQELEVGVVPRRVAISGKRESRDECRTESVVYAEWCPDQIFRILDLPVDVDPSETMATLNDGVLELVMPKAPAPKLSDVALAAE